MINLDLISKSLIEFNGEHTSVRFRSLALMEIGRQRSSGVQEMKVFIVSVMLLVLLYNVHIPSHGPLL